MSAVARSAQHRTILHAAIILSIVYVGVPLVLHIFSGDSEGASHNGSNESTQVAAPTVEVQAALAPQPHQPLVTLSSIGGTLRMALLSFRHGFALAWRIPGLLVLPIRHAYSILSYVFGIAAAILHPVFVPLVVAIQFIFAFITAPVVLLHRIATALYPIYILIGAACVCGVFTGIAARAANSVVVKSIIGVPRTSSRRKAAEGRELERGRRLKKGRR